MNLTPRVLSGKLIRAAEVMARAYAPLSSTLTGLENSARE